MPAGVDVLRLLNNARLAEAIRFLAAGGLATLSHWLTMALLIVTGTAPSLATAIGAVAGAGVNYLMQKVYAFRSANSHGFALPRYVAACVLLWLSNLLLFVLLHRLFTLPVVPAQFLTTAFVAMLSYWLYRHMVFIEPGIANARNSSD
jgi:putative flippase GtrA